MKRFLYLLIIVASMASCSKTTIVKSKPLPPGQMKKVTGAKSAKTYAPGQQKKNTVSVSSGSGSGSGNGNSGKSNANGNSGKGNSGKKKN